MGTVRTDEFRKDAVRIALTSGLSATAYAEVEQPGCLRHRRRWGI